VAAGSVACQRDAHSGDVRNLNYHGQQLACHQPVNRYLAFDQRKPQRRRIATHFAFFIAGRRTAGDLGSAIPQR
jgi:hypothetical protein